MNKRKTTCINKAMDKCDGVFLNRHTKSPSRICDFTKGDFSLDYIINKGESWYCPNNIDIDNCFIVEEGLTIEEYRRLAVELKLLRFRRNMKVK